MERRAAAYDYRLDVQAREDLDLQTNSPVALEKRKTHKRYVRRQMETLLGEKLHVLLSVTRYNLIDGKLYGENMFVPAIDSFRKGRNHRRIHGNPIDFSREDAEVEGFTIVEERMGDPDTPVGHMEFFPSLPGGTYKHRFHDIFTKKADDKGKKFVEARRYSSGLEIHEYRDFVKSLGVEISESNDATFFLANPVSIEDPRFQTADDIHKHLHREHGYMTKEEFEAILRATNPYIEYYVQNPNLLAFKAVLNRADEVNDERKNGIISIVGPNSKLLLSEIHRLGSKPIEKTDLPCGNLEEPDENSAFSVVEFDINYTFDEYGFCEECDRETSLGPCGLCRPCDIKIRQKKKFGMAA